MLTVTIDRHMVLEKVKIIAFLMHSNYKAKHLWTSRHIWIGVPSLPHKHSFLASLPHA